MAKTAADLIAATLQKAGVRRVDGVVSTVSPIRFAG